MDASTSGGGGSDGGAAGTDAGAAGTDAAEPWDWGNLLDFTINGDDDPFLLPWGTTDVIQPPLPAPPQAASAASSEASGPRVRKRDPRLVCPNYLAGRVPCACPEMDEMAAAAEAEDVVAETLVGARKRARARGGGGSGAAAGEVRCQVPGCEADIRELKGYHRRHRVCLRCAHASSVVLDGTHKRYCQQCGKFHILPDFDEGKRSCRRKLERHNKRRRRRPDFKSTMEKELEDQLDLSGDASGDGELREDNTNGTASEIVEAVVSNKTLDRETPLGSEDGHSSPTCTLPTLQNDQSNSLVSFAASTDACIDAKLENTKLAHSPIFCDSKSAYSSSCPTRRLSFKLYDWNPAEFPRRLRHQIFEWLASMPVELEGYIRPGCTILTVYIAMPQHMWDKLSEDAAHLVRDLVNSPGSLLLGKGTFFIYLHNMIFQILKDGTSLMNIRLEVQAPKIHYVHPTCFEAGKPIEFVVCGSYLDQPKFRSLVSFDGKYLKHDCYRMASHKINSCVEKGEDTHNSRHEIFQINITQSDVDAYGPAFIEVENVSGLSNFVPILFGSKQLCSELERIEQVLYNPSCENNICGDVCGALSNLCEHFVLKQTAMSGLLLDIGWLVRKPCPDELKNVLSLGNIQRWTSILRFLIHNDFTNVLEIVLHSLDNTMDSEVISNLEKGRLEADVVMFLEYVSHARGVIHHRTKHDVRPQLGTNHVGDIFPHNSRSSIPFTSKSKSTNRADYSSSASATCEEEQSIGLVTKEVTHRQCCHPKLHARCLNHSFAAALPGSAMRIRIVVTLTVAAVLCFAACIVVFHPHKGVMLAVPVNRYLFGDTNL